MKLKSWIRREFRYLRKRSMWGLALSFLYVSLAIGAGAWMVSNDLRFEKTVTEDVQQITSNDPIIPVMSESEVHMTLETHYLCGEITEEMLNLPLSDIDDWKKAHPTAILVDQGKQRLYWRERINDIAPQCKANGFMSIDDQGRLTLFQGPPNDGKAIRTFYQIEIKHLESGLPLKLAADLYRGIRITNLNEFDSVLTTYRNFAVRP
jgi:forespore regulator of the sigma-K checkpoint